MVTNTIATITEVLQEIYKLASLVKEVSEKVDSFYPLEEEDLDLIEEDEVVASDLWDEDEIEQQCQDFHSGTRDDDSED
jgi:hypothetical protein